MKFFERINHSLASHPFLLYLFIVIFAILPFIVTTVNNLDKELKAEQDQKEKQKVCVEEKSQLRSTFYTIEVCNDDTSRILTINGTPIQKDANK